MNPLRPTCAALLLCWAVAPAAAAPGLREIAPPVVQRGVENEVRVYGVELTKDTQLLLPFAATVRGSCGSAEAGSYSIEPAADVPPGVYPVRLRTPQGVTNLRLVAVTDVPVVRAKEPNGLLRTGKLDLKSAQAIEPPCVVVGGRLVRDLDAFRFPVKSNSRLTFVTENWRTGLTPDPTIRLLDGRGRTLARAHDTPTLFADERIDHTFADGGDHFMEVRSTGGGGWINYYLLKVGDFDYAQTVFPLGGRRGETVAFTVVNRDGKTSTVKARVPQDPWADHWRLPLPSHPGSLPWPLAAGGLPEVTEDEKRDGAQKLDWPVTVNGRIGKPDETDYYRLAVEPGQVVRLSVEAYQLGSPLDGYLMVIDPSSKKVLAKHDDQIYRALPDPALDFEVPEGMREVVVALRDTLGRSGRTYGYRLTVERGGPDFFLTLGNKQRPTNKEDNGWHRLDRSDVLNLVRGQEATLKLSVRRTKADDSYYNGPVLGYSGPITIKAANVPAGVTVKPLVIPAGKTEGELVVVASDRAPKQPFEIVVHGEGTRPDDTTIRRVAERRIYLSSPQSPHLPWNWRVQKVTCAVTSGEDRGARK